MSVLLMSEDAMAGKGTVLNVHARFVVGICPKNDATRL